MKKRIIIIAITFSLAAPVIFFGAWMYAIIQSKPLYGNYDIGLECMGGHEIFLDLDSDEAFNNCPGHRSRTPVGRIVRTSDSVTIIDPRDDTPWFRIDWKDSAHTLSFIKRPDHQSTMGMIPVRGTIQQVTNPWRLWLPRLLPEV